MSKQQIRAINSRTVDVAEAFYRSIGFRRIGASNFLALSSDPTHKSHAVAPTDDFQPSLGCSDPDVLDEDEAFDNDWLSGNQRKENARLDRLKKRLPIHHAAVTFPDSECLEFLQALIAKMMRVGPMLITSKTISSTLLYANTSR